MILSLIFGWGPRVSNVESTSQEWVGGLQESGYGTDYRLMVKVKAGSDEIRFDALWVGDICMKVRVFADPAGPQGVPFKKGSRLTLKAGVTFRPGPDGKIGPTESVDAVKPVNFKGQGLLCYHYKGEPKYLEIADFKKLEKIIYP